jgi:hypothetical protein
MLIEKPPSAAAPADEDDTHCFPYYDFVRSLIRRFDGSFIFVLFLENFNFGLWILVQLSYQDLFKDYLQQDPGDMAMYNSLITLPWCFKILFGLITDNVKLCGLKRKPYLIFFGVVQFMSMSSLYFFEIGDALQVALILMTASLAMAFSNVVVDAILVV